MCERFIFEEKLFVSFVVITEISYPFTHKMKHAIAFENISIKARRVPNRPHKLENLLQEL